MPTVPTPSRRSVAKGAAWTLPVLAVGAAAPAMAASGCPMLFAVAPSYTAPAPSAGASGSVTTTWTVPRRPPVTRICFQIIGGGGGGTGATRAGGSGALLTGGFAVTPGEVLTFVVAAGGVRGALTGGVFPGVTGGGGYGSGGSSNQTGSNGGSGGAAAAPSCGARRRWPSPLAGAALVAVRRQRHGQPGRPTALQRERLPRRRWPPAVPSR